MSFFSKLIQFKKNNKIKAYQKLNVAKNITLFFSHSSLESDSEDLFLLSCKKCIQK